MFKNINQLLTNIIHPRGWMGIISFTIWLESDLLKPREQLSGKNVIVAQDLTLSTLCSAFRPVSV